MSSAFRTHLPSAPLGPRSYAPHCPTSRGAPDVTGQEEYDCYRWMMGKSTKEICVCVVNLIKLLTRTCHRPRHFSNPTNSPHYLYPASKTSSCPLILSTLGLYSTRTMTGRSKAPDREASLSPASPGPSPSPDASATL